MLRSARTSAIASRKRRSRISAARASGAHSNTMPRLVFWPTAAWGGFDRSEDARADRCAGRGDRAGRRLGAASKIRDGRPMTVGVDVDVARLRRLEFVEAGRDIGVGDFGSQRVHIATNRVFVSSEPRKSRATTPAISVAVTRCRPRHAGMLLTSSTKGRPLASLTMSTPARSASTASAEARASARTSPSPRRQSAGRPA